MSRIAAAPPLQIRPPMRSSFRFSSLLCALAVSAGVAACSGEDRISFAGPPDDASPTDASETGARTDAGPTTDASPGTDAEIDTDLPSDDAAISVSIVAPDPDVCLTGDESVTVHVATTGFLLADPGTCAPGDMRCGQAWVTLDVPCDLPGKPYAASIGKAAEVDLILSACPAPVRGPHVLRVELHLDSGAPLTPTVDAARTITFRPGPC